ncbi:Ca2+/H+ antiporter [Cryphonectria parasitica EP155]|uniref:Vacuolar calcium ion transporter n=1 Tax=Cryphonectria parasitica (strain ATCC 38755 / EP155) TaxID=660469 RepID=A0A9P5CRS6_CRYP1|nr:Ca2+/H+ antiporter [Cryphonectria parasitica EP155]KAF3767837.1 Ca2+/H+ antiporter [Cryphonectria parasitica EP155]
MGNSTITPHIKAAGESGRRGFSPVQFIQVCARSSCKASAAVNILWPFVPAAIAVRYATDNHLVIFILAYIAMVPCANLIGFAGQEFGRKMPHVLGVLIETTFGSVVEIILFLVLLKQNDYQENVIKAAILGSILANMLLCLGLCFFVSGMRRDESHFNEAVSEAGTGLLLTAGFGLAVPTVFANALSGTIADEVLFNERVLSISRVTAIALMVAYFVYVWFMGRTHHGIYEAIFEFDEERDHDRHKDALKDKLTLSECIIALIVSIALVTVIAIALVQQIPYIVENHGVSDSFMGLILVPLVEKAAEHLTAVDEAWDNQMNFALSHVLGATLQTALFNGPLVVIAGWGLDKEMGLDFDTFNMTVLILAILTVGNFLRDQKSNYLEGALCVIVYIIVAAAAFFNPTPGESTSE